MIPTFHEKIEETRTRHDSTFCSNGGVPDIPEIIPFPQKVEEFGHDCDASARVDIWIIESASFLNDVRFVDAAEHAASLGLCTGSI